MSEGTVVSDTGPLIALALIDQLDLLPQLYARICAPRSVVEEVAAGGQDRPGARQILSAGWLDVVEDATPEPLLASQLGRGEAAAIATAHHIKARLVVVDELRARRIATRVYGLPVKGTAGILVQAKKATRIPSVRALLMDLVAKGYYLSTE